MVVSSKLLPKTDIMDKNVDSLSSEELSAKLADKLRNLRAASGLSQEAVAHRAGISTYTYQKFEKGESKPGTPMNPRLDTLFALAGVFGIDVRELFDFLDDGPQGA